MNDVAALASEVDSIVFGSLSISELTVGVTHRLEHLRKLYTADKTAFSAEQIQRLQFAANVPTLVADFVEAVEDSNYITHREDVEELVGRFVQIQRSLVNCMFGKRAAKEARALLERYESFPTRRQSHEMKEKRERENRIQRLTPNCPKCFTRLVLRDSKYGLFWGCQNFPNCFEKQQLTAEQTRLLRDDS